MEEREEKGLILLEQGSQGMKREPGWCGDRSHTQKLSSCGMLDSHVKCFLGVREDEKYEKVSDLVIRKSFSWVSTATVSQN